MVKKLKFYDLKEKEFFMTSKYKIRGMTIKGYKRKFAIAISPFSNKEYWRSLPKNYKK